MIDCDEVPHMPLSRALADACARVAETFEQRWPSSPMADRAAARARAAAMQLRGCQRCRRGLALAQPSWRIVEVDGTTFGLFCSIECAEAYDVRAEPRA
ncbi:hypothetical protein [Sandaracinus amylolyticus]|uniref:hypothetical protein n=1 Tax=Sandaracinus amylolyticus TaxID=927083 RepID=UPI001F19C46E|nr:hypothetical protein [Sandaracinus amylolyticus]UJR84158.1 Hypothetical protein I5071_62290 [Sandaracinus amylolyticus]